MGAGVSTEGAPLTRGTCKNNLGVLFDPEAEEAFQSRRDWSGRRTRRALARGRRVREDARRALARPEARLVPESEAVQRRRVEIEKIANEKIKGTIKEIRVARRRRVPTARPRRQADRASLYPLYEIAAWRARSTKL